MDNVEAGKAKNSGLRMRVTREVSNFGICINVSVIN